MPGTEKIHELEKIDNDFDSLLLVHEDGGEQTVSTPHYLALLMQDGGIVIINVDEIDVDELEDLFEMPDRIS